MRTGPSCSAPRFRPEMPVASPASGGGAAGAAFDAVAASFDETFDPWLSVAAQRAAVRTELLRAFPEGARLLEIGGGTGTDAAWMMARRRDVFLTDASPAMIVQASGKIGSDHCEARAAEDLEVLVGRGLRFDGAYSNFAALNCVADLGRVASALASLVHPGGSAVLVVFGCFSPGEMITELVRGRYRNCLRRLRRAPVHATLRGRRFTVQYHRGADLERAMAPAFRLVRAKAIGLLVPPSAAEPWISRRPWLLAAMAAADKLLARPLAPLGDHVAYTFERCPGS